MYQILVGGRATATIEADERPQVVKVKGPSAIPRAPYDPLIDIAYEQVKRCGPQFWDGMAMRRIEMAGGMEAVEALRAHRKAMASAVRL